MYELYRANGELPQRESTYRRVFDTEFNVAFHPPKKDAGKQCEWFQNLSRNEKDINREEHEAHNIRKTQAREHKNRERATSRATPS